MISTYSTDDEYDMEVSPSLKSSLADAELIATLAEKSNHSKRKLFEVTSAGEYTLLLYPTGSGKSVCYQFPPVYLNKKSLQQ